MLSLARIYACMLIVAAASGISAAGAPAQFVRVTDGPEVNDGGWSFGVSWVDYDGDDYPDLYVNNNVFQQDGEVDFLYHNNGDGTYTIVSDGAMASEGGSVASTWADFDNDGDIDVYVSRFANLNNLFVNNGDGTFAKKTTGPLGQPTGATMEAEWVDYNNDGRLDLFVANHRRPSDTSANWCDLYRNDGGSFLRQCNIGIGLIGDEGNSIAWGDYDNDGNRDLYWSRNDKSTLLFRNNGDGTFTGQPEAVIAQSPAKYHGNWADYDNDGDLDLYTVAGYPGLPWLLKNTGDGEFEVVSNRCLPADSGYWTGGYWADYDNDGWLDLLMLGHEYYKPHPNCLFHNNGDGTFSRTTDSPVATDRDPSSAAAWADHDHDGDLDLFVANVNDADNALYENLGNTNHWLHIRLVGNRSNRSGIGAKIRVKATLANGPVWQMREVSAKNGFMSQSELAAHFGLGSTPVVDSLVVEWPSGTSQVLTSVKADQRLTITEGGPSTMR